VAKNTSEVVEEIAEAEQARAATITNNPYFTEWVEAIREEFIAKGFLKLFYAWDGRYGRSRRRIEKFGNYILPNEIDMADNKFYPESRRGWIRNEYMWFWFYLSEGQVIAHTSPSSIPEAIKTKGTPGKQIWRRVVKVHKDLGVWGEEGGGVFVSPDQLDERYLIGSDEMQRWVDGKDAI